MSKKLVRINGDVVGTTREGKFFEKHNSSMNWAALLDSEPQMAIKLQLENLIHTYGLEAVEEIAGFVVSDLKLEKVA